MPFPDRFRSRKDTEHVQAFIRLAIASTMALLLIAIEPNVLTWGASSPLVAAAIAIEFAAASILILWIALDRTPSHVRRIIGILADVGTSCMAMLALGVEAAPLWGVCLWIVVGNGLRYGTAYLLGSAAAALVGFGVVILTNQAWASFPIMAWTLWGVLAVVPAYLHRLVNHLTTARDTAAHANAAKTWFLASTSHELRTPLNGVVTAVELLRTTQLNTEQQRLSEAALQGARALSALVGDILDISAIESGSLTLRISIARPLEIAKTVAMMLAATAREKGIALDLEASPDLPAAVELDVQRTQQSLLNLAHNAVKFTDSGSVTIKVAVSDDGLSLVYTVTDTGIGIAPDVLPRIFDAFTQAETGANRRFGGTGIGTTIARELVTRMGGRVFAESTLGKGSRFWFTVPLKLAHTPPSDADSATPPTPGQLIAEHRRRFASRTVLILDDLASNRDVLRALLERLGHEVVETASAVDALDALVDMRVAAAIVDWHMPDVTGYDFLLEARAAGSRETEIPVIVLTADATATTQARAFAAGAVAFLTKPISVPALVSSLETAFGGEPATPALPAQGPEADATLDHSHIEELMESGLTAQTIAHLARVGLDDIRRAAAAGAAALNAGALSSFVDAAHAIKGVAGHIGAPRLMQAAGRAMQCSPTEMTSGHGATLWGDIGAEIALLERAVQARFGPLPDA